MPLSVVKRGSQQCSRKEIRASPVYALEQDLVRIRVSFIPLQSAHLFPFFRHGIPGVGVFFRIFDSSFVFFRSRQVPTY